MTIQYGDKVKLKPGVAADHQLKDWPDDATGTVIDKPPVANPEGHVIVFWPHRGAKSVWAQAELEKVNG